MTVGPFGSPDWLRPQPGGQKALYNGTYAAGANPSFFQTPDYVVAGYAAVALTWIPDQDQLCQVFFDTGLPSPVLMYQRQFTAKAGTTLQVNIPTPTQLVAFRFSRLDGATNPTGTARISGHQATDNPGGHRGVVPIYQATGISCPSGGATTIYPAVVTEGPHTFALTSGGNAICTINTLTPTNVYTFLAQIQSDTQNAAKQAMLFLPALQLQLQFQSKIASADSASLGIIAGE